MQPRPPRGLTLMEALFSIVVIGILFSVLLPLFTTKITGSESTVHLSNAKQIYLGLETYAGDHNGEFPNRKPDGGALDNANEAYRQLFPNYIDDKRLFYNRWSVWTPTPPDNNILPGVTPAIGENQWAYMPNLTRASNPSFPIIATGFPKGSPGIYSNQIEPKELNTKNYPIIVVRKDGSGKSIVGTGKEFRVYEKISLFEKIDIFKPAPGWLRPDQAPLNPEG